MKLRTILFAAWLTACGRSAEVPQGDTEPPPAPREFRAAWVASVANIDWPSRKDLTVAEQQAEILAIIARAKELHLNALIVQVRPSADALYRSELEPWSEYLTGEQGKAPFPLYDPLETWITEAHHAGLELHAWFNPYRAQHTEGKSAPAANHISKTNPAIVKAYGGYLWMDPGEAAARQRTLEVMLDVAKRYDVDGVHIDDYFYPYPVNEPGTETEIDFPDEPSWQAYTTGGGKLARADWRRKNVSDLIEQIHASVHLQKHWMKFGISPFGIGRPDKRPAGVTGFSQYDKLYADVELWLKQGWLDYLAPQLYWPTDPGPRQFSVLLDYWMHENPRGRHVWPGLFTSRIDGTAKSWEPEEVVRQIGVMRDRGAVGGHMHFSMAALLENRAGITDRLRSGPYRRAALSPATPWLGANPPAVPRATYAKGKLHVASDPQALQIAVWSRLADDWRFDVFPAAETEWPIEKDVTAVVVSAVDRLGNESARVRVAVPKP